MNRAEKIVEDAISSFTRIPQPDYVVGESTIDLHTIFDEDNPIKVETINEDYGVALVSGFTGGVTTPLARQVFERFDALRKPLMEKEHARQEEGAQDLIDKVKDAFGHGSQSRMMDRIAHIAGMSTEHHYGNSRKLEEQLTNATKVIEEHPEYLEFAADRIRNFVDHQFKVRHMTWQAMLRGGYQIPGTDEQILSHDDREDLLRAIDGEKYLNEQEGRKHTMLEATLDMPNTLMEAKRDRVIQEIQGILDTYDGSVEGAIGVTSDALSRVVVPRIGGRKSYETKPQKRSVYEVFVDSDPMPNVNDSADSFAKKIKSVLDDLAQLHGDTEDLLDDSDVVQGITRKLERLDRETSGYTQEELGVDFGTLKKVWKRVYDARGNFGNEDRAMAEIFSVLGRNAVVVERYGTEIKEALAQSPRQMAVLTGRRGDLEGMLTHPENNNLGTPQESAYLVMTGVLGDSKLSPKEAQQVVFKVGQLKAKYGDDLKLVLGKSDLEFLEAVQFEPVDPLLDSLYETLKGLPVAVNLGEKKSVTSDYIDDHVPSQFLGREASVFRPDFRLCVTEEVDTSGKITRTQRTSDEMRYDVQVKELYGMTGDAASRELPLVKVDLSKPLNGRKDVRRDTSISNYVDGRESTLKIQGALEGLKVRHRFVQGFCRYVASELDEHMNPEQVAQTYIQSLNNVVEGNPELPHSLGYVGKKEREYLSRNLPKIVQHTAKGVFGKRVNDSLTSLLDAASRPKSVFD